jgi:hypothetical protein
VETTRAVARRFSSVSGLRSAGEGRFEGDLDADWTIAGKPNGGYLLAMLGRAATWEAVHDHVVAVSAHYLRAPDPGPVELTTEVLRSGRSASQVRARMAQDGVPCVEALVTTSHLDTGTTRYWQAGDAGAAGPAFDDCPRLVPVMPGGRPVAIMEQVEIRLDPATAGFRRGEPSGRGELRGWLALPAGEDFDATSLLYAVDSFPPATFDVEFSGWVPTLELTAYVRALPVPGPVRILQRANLVESGRVDETCLVWDGAGRLVAQGTQLAAIRLG